MRFLFGFLWVLISVLGASVGTLHAQSLPHFPKDLIAPLNIPLALSGTFGEMRAQHYHTGWDLQTNEKEGLPVFAIADGYISRVRISSKGYGFAVYINHPKWGITSVYAHLSDFYPALKSWVESQQYALKKNELDWILSPEQFPISQGGVIGYSGNTGSSGGPHLHFELRNLKTEKTIDPALFGYTIPDVTRPVIESLMFVPKGSFKPSEIIPFRFNGESLGKDTLYEVADTFGVAVQVYDWVLDAEHPCGIKQILTLWDGNIVSEWLADSMDFTEVKHVNAQWLSNVSERYGKTTYRTYQLPNSPGTGFLYIENDGWLNIKDTMVHAVTVMTSDFSGNATCVYAYVQKARKPLDNHLEVNALLVDWTNGGTIAQGDWNLRIPVDAVYEKIPMTWRSWEGIEKSDSMQMKITIEPKGILFKNAVVLENHALDWNALSLEEKRKWGWMEVRKNDEWIGWEEEKNGFLLNKTGTYRWVRDSKCPKVLNPNTALTQGYFEIEETESGLKNYSASCGDQWIKLYWDAKKNQLRLDPKWRDKCKGKEGQLTIELEDRSGNREERIIR